MHDANSFSEQESDKVVHPFMAVKIGEFSPERLGAVTPDMVLTATHPSFRISQ